MIQHVDEVHKGLSEFYRTIPDEILFAPAEPDGWTVAKNIKHITSTNRLLASWAGLPRWFIRLRGKPANPQMRIEDRSATNRPNIRNYGKYPKAQPVHPGAKESLIAELLASAEKLKAKLMTRSESDLDSLAGPFGGMSLRNAILFAMKHGVHHSGVVRARLDT